jgi:protein-S-isoprenylcysteine O-methyltransferase Ste14
MTQSFNDLIALITLLVSPVVPLFWVPVHCLPHVFRRFGLWTYLLPVLTWLPLDYLIYDQRSFLLRSTVTLHPAVRAAGALLLVSGIALQAWTVLLLTLPGILGMPEVTSREGTMVTEGPFSVVRHPTYLSHTQMYLGVFLLTGVVPVGVVAVIDAVVVNAVIIPLEEQELSTRFGASYEEYRKKVPSRFLPVRWKRG